jgi:hypothetical protein
MEFKLKTPSWRMFIVSTVLILLVLAAKFGIQIPILRNILQHTEVVTFAAWLMLFASVTFDV